MIAPADDTATRLGARADAIASWREMAADRFNAALFVASALATLVLFREERLHPGQTTVVAAMVTTLTSAIALALRKRVPTSARVLFLYVVVAAALGRMMNQYGFADPIPFVSAGTMIAIAGVLLPLRLSIAIFLGYVALVAGTATWFVVFQPEVVGRTDLHDVNNWVRVVTIFALTSAGGLWAVSRYAAWLTMALRLNERAKDAVNSATEARMRHVERGRQLEEELRKARVQGSLEMLAGGVAKDFQSLLAVTIRGATQAARETRAADREAALEVVRTAGRQGTALADRLLEYSQGQSAEQHWLDPNAVIAGSLPLIHQLFPPNIDLRFERDDSLGRMRAAPGQLDRLLLNLCTEAREWIPAGGSVSLRTFCCEADERQGRVCLSAVVAGVSVRRMRDATNDSDAPGHHGASELLSEGLTRLILQLGGRVEVRARSSREREVVVTLPRGAPPEGLDGAPPSSR